MKISRKRQVSLPKGVMDTLHLKPGDEVEFEVDGNTARLIPVKTIRVPREQAWFWTPEWQKLENEADSELASGRYKDFDTLDELVKDLHGED